VKAWSRPFSYIAVIAVVAGAYFIGMAGRGDRNGDAALAMPPDPGYSARDAEVIETGQDGRERYRLNAKVIYQQPDSGQIDLEQLEMNYHPSAQPQLPGEKTVPALPVPETWHVKADRGQVRANGDDVQLNGNVQVTGPTPGSGTTLTLNTETMRINTPTQFIETDAPVQMHWSGNDLSAVGMEADLKAGTVRLKSQVHGNSAP